MAILGIIQLVLFCFYDTFLTIFAKLTAENPNVHDTNIIGWFYVRVFFWKKIETLLITFSFQTSPLNAIISPTAVLLYISWIKKNRQMHIRKMTKVNKSENGCHFQQLSVMWNKWILMIFWKMFRTVIWFAMMSASIKNCKINFVNLVTRGFTGKYLKGVNNSLVFTEIYLEFPDFQKFTLCKLISKQQQIFAEKVP